MTLTLMTEQALSPRVVFAAALVLGGLLLPALPARADQPLWELGVGVGALRLPHYRGASEASNWVLPSPFVVYRGKILRSDRDGTRAVLFDGQRIDFDLSFSAGAPVRSRDDMARQGMPDLAPTVEVGPRLNARLASGNGWKLDLRVPVRAVLTLQSRPRNVGWIASPVLNLDLDLRGTNLGLQAGPLWGDQRLHAHYYEVLPAYATGIRPAYAAQAGYAGWAATVAASRRTGPYWLAGYVRADSVAGAVFDDSPLVKRPYHLSVGIAAAWVFATSEERVANGR